jgi:hypothetical protein
MTGSIECSSGCRRFHLNEKLGIRQTRYAEKGACRPAAGFCETIEPGCGTAPEKIDVSDIPVQSNNILELKTDFVEQCFEVVKGASKLGGYIFRMSYPAVNIEAYLAGAD